VQFSSQKNFSIDVQPSLVKKTKQKYVLPLLDDFTTITINFDVKASKGAHNIFALVVNLLKVDQQPKHVIIKLFKTNEIIEQALAKNLTP
jgi:hypothetical protein